MAIKLTRPLWDFDSGTILRDIGYDIEKRIVALGLATYTLTDGVEATVGTFNRNTSAIEQSLLSLESLALINRSGFPQGPFSSPYSGWGFYADTQYTEGSPFQIIANTPATLPNNAGYKDESQMPQDECYYDPENPCFAHSRGDAFLAMANFRIKPTTSTASYIDFWFELESAPGVEYLRTPYLFPRGVGVERQVTPVALITISSSWSASRAVFKIESNGPCDIYGINLTACRVHRGRV